MSGLRAGAAVADITPTQPVRLAGFMARQPTVPPLVVADPLQVRVLALQDGDTTGLLAVFDLVGMSAAFAGPVRLAIATATGVPVERVMTSCTHTHSGPDTLLGMDLYAGYVELLTLRAVEAAQTAVAALRPVSVGAAEVAVPLDLAVNRRGFPHEPRLQVVDLLAGTERVATVVGVGIHPVTHGPDVHVITADWVGHCRVAVEAALGGTALVVAGALGDVNPPGGDGYDRSGGGAALACSVGTAVAGLATTAAKQTKDVGTGLALSHRTVELPVAQAELSRLVSGGADAVVTELFTWSVGDLLLRSLPGEALSGFAAALPRPGTTVDVGLAPVWQGYLPHPDLMGGGYEDELGLGADAMSRLLVALGAA
ncbi:MAG: hypothetical protein JJD92_10125 [Frankiaceae bacterium]|nr:hypothetical protein [Frankiaceae bacterium]